MFTLLVGAEGCAEAEGAEWLREATDEEAKQFAAENPKVANIDGIGRPYFLMTVLDSAPADVLERAKRNLRVLRLTG